VPFPVQDLDWTAPVCGKMYLIKPVFKNGHHFERSENGDVIPVEPSGFDLDCLEHGEIME
jgi:hypothetical protein